MKESEINPYAFVKTMPWSVAELEDLYKRTDSGHWFDRGNMLFFKRRLPGDFRRIDDKTALFISTEKVADSRRKATVRIARIRDIESEDGFYRSKVAIATVGDFNRMSLPIAKKFMQAWGQSCE